jgi:uncharacterized protein (TIGR02271 family)
MTNTQTTGTTGYGYGDRYSGRALVALFAGRDTAREAAHRLHDEGFHDTWIGVTHVAGDSYDDGELYMAPVGSTGVAASSGAAASGDVVVESDSDSIGDKIGRFFTGESGTRSLYDELVNHGVDRASALRVEDQIPPESAVLTVDAANHPEAAAAIIEQAGGHLIAGEGFASAGASATAATVAAERRGSEVLGYGDPQQYARGTKIDEERRLQLRAERLSIDKRQESLGEATIGKDVVETRQEIDVPLIREVLFVERRPASDSTVSTDTSPIGTDDTITIPLLRERVVVTKRPVVTGEYVIGKRAVTEMEHVSETTREERLRVDDVTGVTPKSSPTVGATADDLADGARV